jgi:hypothetical protein
MTFINLQKPPGFHRITSHKASSASTSGRIKKMKTRIPDSTKVKPTVTLQVAQFQMPPEQEKPKVVFSKAKMDYLERQFFKCPRPEFHQLHYLAQQIEEHIGLVQEWFRQRPTAPTRPLRSFDVIDQALKMPDHLDAESYIIDTLQLQDFHVWM